MFSFESEWRKRIERSPEAKLANQNLEFHRRKIRQLHEELTHAEAWERELEARLQKMKDKVKPRILVFSEQLESCKGVEDKIIEATVVEEDSEKLIGVLRKKAISMDKLDRSQLLGFIKTILNVRNGFLDAIASLGVGMPVRQIVKKHNGLSLKWSHIASQGLNVSFNLMVSRSSMISKVFNSLKVFNIM